MFATPKFSGGNGNTIFIKNLDIVGACRFAFAKVEFDVLNVYACSRTNCLKLGCVEIDPLNSIGFGLVAHQRLSAA